jgi:hypothetical protein
LRRGVPDSKAIEQEQQQQPQHYKPAISVFDVLNENRYHFSQNTINYQPKSIQGDAHHYNAMDDFDWDEFVSNEYRKLEDKEHHSRRLNNDYNHVQWFNYFPMTGVKTEYYHRYSGTQTIVSSSPVPSYGFRGCAALCH